MSIRDKILGRPEDVKASKDADAALHANSERERRSGIHEETDEYLELNGRANEAADKLPW